MKEYKLPFSFYLANGIIGIAVYLSYHLFSTHFFIALQPYFLIFFFIAYTFVVFKKTESLKIAKYLPVLLVYMLLFSGVLLYEYLKGRGSQFWLYEWVIQLSVTGTSVLIGYGMVYIFFRIKELKSGK